jgi:WhiB family redox-sensing transcriptional regulator
MQQYAEQWQRFAACKGPHADLFYPPNTTERREEKANREADAKMICNDCPVKDECLDYAIAINETHGIWGGLNELERKNLTTRRRRLR